MATAPGEDETLLFGSDDTPEVATTGERDSAHPA